MKKIFAIAILIFSGCSTIELIEGICYNDKDGTYLCPRDPKEELYIDPKPDLFDQCMGLETTSAWHWCIDINRIA